jgi:uncharacterized membrane protein YphA (DoxX/SURF4 family)
MNVIVWICQALLSAVFAVSGTLKSVQSKPRMIASGQTGVQAYSLPFIRFIAASELLGAAGLILPRALHIAPILTPLAAAGLAVIMIGAAVSHARLHEPRSAVANAVLFVLCVVVMLGRAS